MLSNFHEKLVPKSVKPFLKHITPAARKVVNWKELVSDFSNLTIGALENKPIKERFQNYQLPQNVELKEKLESPLKASQMEGQVWVGEKVLEIYFKQLDREGEIFLDLRHGNFEKKENSLNWSPTRLTYKFSSDFREGLLDVYEGYYLDKPDSFDSGLEKMGLWQDRMTEEQKEQIKNLLEDHIGSDDKHATLFSMENFEESFDTFFQYLKNHSITLPSDFVFFGIYLVGLYSHLDPIGEELDVAKAYRNALQ